MVKAMHLKRVWHLTLQFFPIYLTKDGFRDDKNFHLQKQTINRPFFHFFKISEVLLS